MKEGITLKQTDEAKLERSREILEALKEARGGKLLDSHRVMGNDPNLINMFYQQYVNCNKKDISIPKKYRELIVMAVGIATSKETTMKVHGKLALENGATIDEIFEVIRILFVLHLRRNKTASSTGNPRRSFRSNRPGRKININTAM